MADSGGVEVSRKAIEDARKDLEEALGLLDPNNPNGTKTPGMKPVLGKDGYVAQLSGNTDALAGFWPAAFTFQQSTSQAIGVVTTQYANINMQVGNAILLLTQALKNFNDFETGGTGKTAQV
ncbi:hypothetical protein [Nonomuraea endophytica]|uniref:Uncharacterized protein n=1 Tax=Nonomuraea endophytica TaxID=714136 RepID=A0A7W7ZW42_9ACTN|nr:hypothetical protein [Nonomuraea endophytica]MBB5074867.1 hypothetical protein [Nonomuraea endophytica]